jgi:hypothetical protein
MTQIEKVYKMKDMKFTKKRVVCGLLCLALAVLLGVVFKDYLGAQSEMWQLLGYIAVVFGLGLAALMITFMGWRGFFWGVASGIIVVALVALPKLLPEPWNRYYSVVYLAGLFVYINLKKKKNTQTETEETLPEELEEDLGEAPAIPEAELLVVHNPLSGGFYQVFRTGGRLVFYRVGGELKGVDPALLQSQASGLRPVTKKDLVLPLDQLRKVKYKEIASNNAGYDCMFVAKMERRSYRFVPLSTDESEKCRAFFREWIPEEPTVSVNEGTPDAKRMKLFEKLRVGYYIYIGTVSLCWLFLNVPYMLFAVLALLGVPALLVLYICFPNEFTLLEKTRSTKKITLAVPLLTSGLALLLRALLDYNILQWDKLLVVALIALLSVTAIVLALTKEWRAKKVAIFYLLFALLTYIPGAVIQINCTFDTKEPTSLAATVQDLTISTSSKSPDTYNVHVVLDTGEELTLATGKEHYESLRIGEKVEVYVFPGVLGISYAYVV